MDYFSPIKKLLRPAWQCYIKWCIRHPNFAPPVRMTLASYGSLNAHPAYLRHGWDRDDDHVFKILADSLEEGDTFLDVGANIGQTTLIGSRKVGPDGRVVAFEPSLPNIEMLKYHLRWNRISNVKSEPTCVGNANGEAIFSLLSDGSHSSNSLTFSRITNPPYVHGLSTNVTIPIITLDHYCLDSGVSPNVIKIDVEGAELDVLLGAQETIARCRPILIIGVHPFWWPDDQDPNALTDFLGSINYTTRTTQGLAADPEIYADFICTHNE